jgi:hypothetical protein
VLRYCIPRVRNRGHGLGNELVPWARAFLASQLLDAKLLPPAFGLNRRGYWRHFLTSPDDWIYHRAMQHLLPVVEFNESDYLAHGGGDVVDALRSFAAANDLHRRRIFALVTEGMWGGYSHVQAAREFMRSTLYQSRYAARNLLRLQQRIDPNKVLVGMHVRLGDFASPSQLADYRRSPNTSLPIEWFANIAEHLRQAFAEDWQLLLVSDGGPEELQPLLSRYPCIVTGDIPNGDCSDVLALSRADLLICSASSYSSLAATLSESPYVWFAGNLHEHPEGCYSMHGESKSPSGNLRTLSAIAHFLGRSQSGVPRGAAVDADGKVPVATLDAAARRREWRRWETDLVSGGVTPMPVLTESQVRRLSR